MTDQQKQKIIYVYDALCGWCYGFSPVMMKAFETYRDEFTFEVISGGMILGDREGEIGKVAPYIKEAYKTVEATAGVKFGEHFIHDVLEKGTFYFSSEKPAIALAVFKTYKPKQAVNFAHQLQNYIYFKGLDMYDYNSYYQLIKEFDLDVEIFIEQMKSDEFKQAAYYDFALSRQLNVSGFPTVFIQEDDKNFHMIARGYTDWETLQLRIENVKNQIKA